VTLTSAKLVAVPRGRVESRLSPALPHQTVHAIFPHKMWRATFRTRLSDVLHTEACADFQAAFVGTFAGLHDNDLEFFV
jgi:hypothetical protein